MIIIRNILHLKTKAG